MSLGTLDVSLFRYLLLGNGETRLVIQFKELHGIFNGTTSFRLTLKYKSITKVNLNLQVFIHGIIYQKLLWIEPTW